MIILPTRRRLERRRDALYRKLHYIIRHASVSQVEEIMRRIHGINLKLKTYFNNKEGEYEAATEIFDIEDPFEEEDSIITVPLDQIPGEEPL